MICSYENTEETFNFGLNLKVISNVMMLLMVYIITYHLLWRYVP